MIVELAETVIVEVPGIRTDDVEKDRVNPDGPVAESETMPAKAIVLPTVMVDVWLVP